MSILKFVKDFYEIFTSAKSFKDNDIFGSYWANRCGLHVLRLCMGHWMTQFRWWLLSWRLDKDLRDRFHKDGYLIIEDFLPEELFNKLEAEMRVYERGMRECHQGNTVTQRVLFDFEDEYNVPALLSLKNMEKLNNLFRYCGAANHSPVLYKEKVNNGVLDTDQPDPQKNLHSDTFHPTVKAWIYLDDVTEENGPYNYVRGSNRLTWERVKWEYNKSLDAKNSKDAYTQKGSFRANENDLKELGLPEPQAITAKKNTLVIANTYGFHKRGEAQDGTTRLSLYAQDRANPFPAFFTCDYVWTRDLRVWALKRRDYLNEREALAKGTQPMWRRSNLSAKKQDVLKAEKPKKAA